jgi:3-oxoacyl-[acyl-carrier protein] reductase
MIDYAQLRGKTVAITGASRGIGRETARLLSKLGVYLVLGSRSIEDLKVLETELSSENLMTIPLDVTDENSVSSFCDHAIERFGKVDCLIHCAGTGIFKSVLELSADEFDLMISVNLRGTFLCSKYFGSHMLQQKNGVIINLVSIAGTTALPGCGGYSASKFGTLGLTKVLQAELRSSGIQVTAVLPGAVDTPFWDTIQNPPNRSSMIPADVLAQHLVYLLCLPKGSVVDELTIMPPLGVL